MSEELEKIIPTEAKLLIQGKEREIKFDFSAWAKLEKKYGGVNNFTQLEKDMSETPFESIPELLYIGLKDKEGVTIDNILDGYGIADIETIATVLTQALYGSLPQDKTEKTSKKKSATTQKK